MITLLLMAFSDPGIFQSVQHDIIAWHMSQGKSREQVCATVSQYFDVRCVAVGNDFVLTRGIGTEITYLSTISFSQDK